MHPMNRRPFDFNRTCGTCIHFTDKVRVDRGTKYRTIMCAHDPDQRNLGDHVDTVWKALPGCDLHKPRA